MTSTFIMKYKMAYDNVYNNKLVLQYLNRELSYKLKCYIEDNLGTEFMNTIDITYENGIFTASFNNEDSEYNLKYYSDNYGKRVPRDLTLRLYDEEYILVDINSDFPEYRQLQENVVDYDPDFNYIEKPKKKKK
jgi:hypothetical protein